MFAAVSVEAVARHKGVVNTRNAEFQVSMHWRKNYFVKIMLYEAKKLHGQYACFLLFCV